MRQQTVYDPLWGAHYPAAPVSNSRCHSCYHYAAKTISCDYMLNTGKRRQQAPTDCTKYLPRSLVRQRRHPWDVSLKQ